MDLVVCVPGSDPAVRSGRSGGAIGHMANHVSDTWQAMRQNACKLNHVYMGYINGRC